MNAKAVVMGALWSVLGGCAWLMMASCAFLYLAGLWDNPSFPPYVRPYQWAVFIQYFGGAWDIDLCLAGGAIIATLPFIAYVRVLFVRNGGFQFRQFANRRRILRGESDNHGHADYASLVLMQGVFPAEPDAEVGGVVVGEADRVDLGPVSHMRFDPDLRSTWGNGGKAPLLIDPCRQGSTHSMVIGGGGTYKSTTLVTSLLTWTKSAVVLDPSEELGDIVGNELRARGKRVFCLGIESDDLAEREARRNDPNRISISTEGPNVLDGIDINSPMAETRLRAIVGRVTGPMSGDSKDDKFKRWGRSIILALLAHMMWDDQVPPELKTLRALRAGIDGGVEVVKNRLRGIAEVSRSPLARSLASGLHDMVTDTFSGALGNAADDTEWLASSTYADLVSGDAYRMRDLVNGDMVVFIQVPLEALESTPAVARVLVGCHLDAVFAAKGRVNGRVWFPIDEAVLIGRDPSLKVARDQGRKSKITLQLFYQSEGQIEEVWTPAGKAAWFDGLSWRTYAGVQNLKLAKELSDTLGTHGVRAWSQGTNTGRSGRSFEAASRSKGANVSEHEISRKLANPDELLAGMRSDERITLVRNESPMRHGAAIAFRRQELAHLLGKSTYRAPYQTAAE